ncbi:DUF3147 family protein [Staphylococcus debuckii]|uniref:DUF3147 family protein n=1 Tax=Staphylococcus debuckii TaxID=2044912 RepID=A0ABU9EZS7_9STAP|nr:DUF3147 family protein [Staphylococcus debuckii]AYU56045.1 DUF3147 family protein [Staphylococcus debuckii]
MKMLLVKFLAGGASVALSYIVSVLMPWKEFGGIFAVFPAVFLISLIMSGVQYGDKVASHVSRGAVFGMTGVLFNILATWLMLVWTNDWILSILVGVVVWFVSAIIIFEIVEKIAHLKRGH